MQVPLRSLVKEVEIQGVFIFIKKKLYIPGSLENITIKFLHRFHQSYAAMTNEIRKKYHMLNYTNKIKNFCSNCETCCLLMRNRCKEVQNWPESKTPRERMHIDIGHYLSHKFLLAVDSFSGYTITQPIRNISASEAIRAMTEIFSVTSVPLLTVSDNALCFNSDAFPQFMD